MYRDFSSSRLVPTPEILNTVYRSPVIFSILIEFYAPMRSHIPRAILIGETVYRINWYKRFQR